MAGRLTGRRLPPARDKFGDFQKWNSVVGGKLDKALEGLGDSALGVPREHASHHKGGDDDVMGALTPQDVNLGGSGAVGDPTAGGSPIGHIHGLDVAVPVDIGLANAAGSAGTAVRSDHVHELPTSVLLALGVPFWTKYSVGHAALQAAALTNDIELLSLPAKSVVHAVYVKHSTAFAGAGITAYTLSVGIAGDPTRYMLAHDVLQAIGDTVFLLTSAVGSENHGAATSIRLAATAVGANLDQSSAGDVDAWVLWGTLP